jgi:DNA helicase HerA-like ATPase
MFLALITQRPSELSDTCVSQCANFIILRTLHPIDLKYIREMVPNVSDEIVLQMKNLKPGNAIAFGSAFKVPTVLYIPLPDPMPLSNNVDLESVWYPQRKQAISQVGPVPATVQTSTIATNDVSSIMTQEASQQQFAPQQTVQAVPQTITAEVSAGGTPSIPSGIQIVGNVNN